MVLIENQSRIVTVNFKSDGWMIMTQIKPNEDILKIKINQINIGPEEQKKLVELIETGKFTPVEPLTAKPFDIEDEF